MPAITLAQAEAKLTLWLAADDAVAAGQSFSIAGKSYSLADAKYIRDNIDHWEAKVNKLTTNSGGGIKVFSGVAVDN